MRVAIHCEPGIKWQVGGAWCFRSGLKELGIDSFITDSRARESDIAILLGTTCWRHIETDGRFLLVDRASFNDPHFVSLVWDGHGRRGNHMVPSDPGKRWDRIGCEIHPWKDGRKTVLCGQTETYSPHYASLTDWYDQVDADYFRPHPAGGNPTGLPSIKDWHDVGLAVTLNSSIGVDTVMQGIPTVTMDGAAMAWDVTSHTIPEERFYEELGRANGFAAIRPDRRPWLEWLAWTQWSWDEISDGTPIKHLFEEL